MHSYLSSAKRIVIKAGSSLIIDAETGNLREAWLEALADDIALLRQQHKEIVLVSSGAVALGRRYLHVGQRALKLEEKQAASACGQVDLMRHYQKSFARHNILVSQVLITPEDTENRRRYLNARNTIDTLLQHDIIPIFNENDAVATNELRFGDNDRLAARVAQMVSAEVLVLLSDVNGLYTADPSTAPDAQHIAEIREITKDIEALAGQSRTLVGTGGMVTKIAAAKIANHSGCHMVIMQGAASNPLQRLMQGEKCSWFLSPETPRNARKHWIAGMIRPNGRLVIDDGALAALKAGKSLLPAGVVQIDGTFDRGDVVVIEDMAGNEIARGLCAYSAKDATQIKQRNSAEIEAILGFKGRDEIIHRDDMVLL